MTRKDYPRICANCKYFDECCNLCKRYPETYIKTNDSWCGEFAIVREPKVYEVIND